MKTLDIFYKGYQPLRFITQAGGERQFRRELNPTLLVTNSQPLQRGHRLRLRITGPVHQTNSGGEDGYRDGLSRPEMPDALRPHAAVRGVLHLSQLRREELVCGAGEGADRRPLGALLAMSRGRPGWRRAGLGDESSRNRDGRVA